MKLLHTFVKASIHKLTRTMKTISILFSILFSTLLANAQTEIKQDKDITVTINNANSDDGIMIFGLHNETTFMKSEGVQTKIEKIKDGKVSVIFKNVAPGVYGIITLHDKNSNHKMDVAINGIPKEPYGVSGNEMSFGPPQFIDAKFTVDKEDLTLEIRL